MIKMMAAAAFFTALVSCNSTPKTALTDGEWVLHSMVNHAGEEMVVTQNKPTINFTDSARVNGSAGCNGYFGIYEVTGQDIKIDLGGMTMKMCLDMEVENAFTSQMPSVTNYEIEGNQLLLKNQNKEEIFRFDHVAPAAQQ